MHLGSRLNAEQIHALAPDVVILATGSEYIAPSLTGSDKVTVVSLQDAIYDKSPMGNKVVVCGSDLAGAELAWELVENRGRRVRGRLHEPCARGN